MLFCALFKWLCVLNFLTAPENFGISFTQSGKVLRPAFPPARETTQVVWWRWKVHTGNSDEWVLKLKQRCFLTNKNVIDLFAIQTKLSSIIQMGCIFFNIKKCGSIAKIMDYVANLWIIVISITGISYNVKFEVSLHFFISAVLV